MVNLSGNQRFSEDRPMPIATEGREGVLPVIAIADMDELLDVMERIQQQLGTINNNNNLEPGERFID